MKWIAGALTTKGARKLRAPRGNGWAARLGELADVTLRMCSAIVRRLERARSSNVPVSAAMLSPVDAVSPEQPLEEIAQLFVAGGASQLPVLDHGTPIGVVTRDRVAAALRASGPRATVRTATSRRVVMVSPGDSVADVLDRLRAQPEAVALVCDHGAPVGLLTTEHLTAYLAHARRAA